MQGSLLCRRPCRKCWGTKVDMKPTPERKIPNTLDEESEWDAVIAI